MRIAFDATSAGIAEGERGGVFQYVYQLLRWLPRIAEEHEFRALFALPRAVHSHAIAAFMSSVEHPNLGAVRGRIPGRWMRRLRIPVEVCTGRIDLFHGPNHLLPSCLSCALVVTVHDLAFFRDRGGVAPPPELDAAATAKWWVRHRSLDEMRERMRNAATRADRVIAVSQATADDVVAHLGVAASKVRVVYNGVRDDIRRIADPEALAAVLVRCGIDGPYWLYIGVLDPNKNLDTLIEGFAAFRRCGGRAGLVIAGKSEWYGAVLARQVEKLGLGDAVSLLGRVADADLPALYSGATGVLMPSPLEGFGLPALEAMACGTPVVAADSGALPEIVGAAGLVVDHRSAHAFADALGAITEDAALRARCVEEGLRRATHFSWERAARETLAVYQEAVSSATS